MKYLIDAELILLAPVALAVVGLICLEVYGRIETYKEEKAERAKRLKQGKKSK